MTQVAARRLRAVVAAAFVAAGLCAFPPGCGTDAQGVDTCRTIEQERCRQALACPDQFHLTTQDQVTDCVRFYRDQCLHGLSNPDVGGPQIDQCVQTLRKAGSCAAGGVKTLAECPAVSQQTVLATSPCDLIVHPEEAIECSFLGPPPVQPTFDAATEQPPPDAADGSTIDAPDESAPDASDEAASD